MWATGWRDEGAVTKLRREFKLLVREDEARALSDRLVAELQAPHPEATLITSLYFDRPGFPLGARAFASPEDCLKVRTKEYFPDLGDAPEPRVVLEVKRERNALTRKRRVWLPRRRLAAALSGGDGLDRAWQFVRGMQPVLAVTYDRRVFQRSQAWRVTIDRELRFYAVGSDQALSARRVGPRELNPALAVEEHVIVEVKHIGQELPAWLLALGRGAVPGYSKFATGLRRLRVFRAVGMGGG